MHRGGAKESVCLSAQLTDTADDGPRRSTGAGNMREFLLNNYVLIGFMGSGKTTIGRVLAEKTGWNNPDTDELLVQKAGMTVTDIFAAEGEEGFRRRETRLLEELAESGEEHVIYSCGGGIVLREENRPLLRQLGTVVYLEVSPEEVIRRLGDDTTRPLLAGPDREEKVRTILQGRRAVYEACADITVSVTGRDPQEIAEEILTAGKGTGRKKILVINGPNLNFLGIREKSIYGTQDYGALVSMIEEHAKELGVSAECWQSNHEGAIIDRLQEAYYDPELIGVVINPGAYTHYSYAIHDALKSVFVPKVEIHISDIHEREAFRQVSVTRPACDHQIVGHGLQGYMEGMDYIVRRQTPEE